MTTIIAHRGSSGMAPENTAAAVELAIEQGADFVEIDVQRTADGRLVNFHDCDLLRVTDAARVFPGRPRYRVTDFRWEELRRLDAGSWFHQQYAGERIRAVDEVIAQVDGRIGLLAELSPCAHYERLADDFAATLRAHPAYVESALASGALAVQSFDRAEARRFHDLAPDVPVGVLDADRPTDDELVTLASWAVQVNPQHTVADRELVDRAHELGLAVNVWTADDPVVLRAMLELGVDGIITDYPQSLTQP